MVRETSMICYLELVELGKINERCQMVYQYILKNPSLTDTEIAVGMGFVDPNKVRPRRKDLYDMGLVVECELRPCSLSGKKCHTWEVVDLVARKNFFDKKEVFRVDGYVTRVFKSKSHTELCILVHNWLNKYCAKKYCAKLVDGGFVEGINFITCIRNNV